MALLIDQFGQTLRRLGKAPLFTAITLITLAVAIGANTLVFSAVEGVLLKPLSYPQPERLIGVWTTAPTIGYGHLKIAPFLYFIDREQSKSIEDIGAYVYDSFTMSGTGQPEHLNGIDVTDGTLPLLGVKPVIGRLFTRRDDAANAAKTVLISFGYWQRKFGGSAQAIGRVLTIDGEPHEVIGVLPRDFSFLDARDTTMILPMQWDRGKTKLGNFTFEAIARLKPGVTVEQANAEFALLIPIALRSFPPPDGFGRDMFIKAKIGSDVHELKQDVVGDVGKTLWVLMGSIAMVLLVACANVANLLLVRMEGRRQELAVMSALGAGHGRIASALLAESVLLGVVGSAIGLGLAFVALKVLVAIAPTGLPRLSEIGINLTVLAFTAGLAVLVSLVIGMIPVAKFAGASLQNSLREGGRALSQGRERHRARKTLVVVQVALALGLLICSGLMIRTFQALTNVNPGFADLDSMLTFGIYVPEARVPETNRPGVVHMEQAIAEKLAAIPGVSSVGISTGVPLTGMPYNDPVFAQDHVYKEGELPPVRRFMFVGPGLFSTMGTPLVAGRDLTWDDTYGERPVAIVSENLAKENWGDAQIAIGKKIRVAPTDDWRDVVGVAADVHLDGMSEKAPTSVYWPLLRAKFEGQKELVRRGVSFVIRSPRANSAAFLSEAQRAVSSVDSDLPLEDPSTLGELYTKSMARTSFTLVMLCVAGAMTLLLGVVGIYGVISYAVSQRTREIGIRMAMGAQRQALTSLFVRQGLLLAGIGVVIGVVVAFAATRLMSSLLFNVSPMDPGTYVVATAGILAITWLACYLPSRRAAAVNPVKALRAE